MAEHKERWRKIPAEKGSLRIKLVPYERLKADSFKILVKDLKEDAIVLVDAKLTPEEESELIKETMKGISDSFSGIEMCSLELAPKKGQTNVSRVRNRLAEMMLGKKRGITLIGPATIVRKVKKNPEELLLYL